MKLEPSLPPSSCHKHKSELEDVTAIVPSTTMWEATILRMVECKYRKNLGLMTSWSCFFRSGLPTSKLIVIGEKWILSLNHHELVSLLLIAQNIFNSHWKGKRRQDNLIKWPNLDVKSTVKYSVYFRWPKLQDERSLTSVRGQLAVFSGGGSKSLVLTNAKFPVLSGSPVSHNCKWIQTD